MSRSGTDGSARKRRSARDPDAVAEVATSLLGLTLDEAVRRATRAGCSLRDQTSDGWYTDDQDPGRINVVTRDGRIVTTSVG